MLSLPFWAGPIRQGIVYRESEAGERQALPGVLIDVAPSRAERKISGRTVEITLLELQPFTAQTRAAYIGKRVMIVGMSILQAQAATGRVSEP